MMRAFSGGLFQAISFLQSTETSWSCFYFNLVAISIFLAGFIDCRQVQFVRSFELFEFARA